MVFSTANNAATGVLLADGMIQWVSGDWSAATSITGAVSGATANIAGFVSPSYGIGDKVISTVLPVDIIGTTNLYPTSRNFRKEHGDRTQWLNFPAVRAMPLPQYPFAHLLFTAKLFVGHDFNPCLTSTG